MGKDIFTERNLIILKVYSPPENGIFPRNEFLLNVEKYHLYRKKLLSDLQFYVYLINILVFIIIIILESNIFSNLRKY